jgi:hypothetical protein
LEEPCRQAKTDSILSHSSQANTDILHSKPFHSGQNQLPPFQAIPVWPKEVSSIPLHSSRAKMGFFPTSHSSMANIVDKSSLLSLPSRRWSPNYSVLVFQRPPIDPTAEIKWWADFTLLLAMFMDFCLADWNLFARTLPLVRGEEIDMHQ